MLQTPHNIFYCKLLAFSIIILAAIASFCDSNAVESDWDPFIPNHSGAHSHNANLPESEGWQDAEAFNADSLISEGVQIPFHSLNTNFAAVQLTFNQQYNHIKESLEDIRDIYDDIRLELSYAQSQTPDDPHNFLDTIYSKAMCGYIKDSFMLMNVQGICALLFSPDNKLELIFSPATPVALGLAETETLLEDGDGDANQPNAIFTHPNVTTDTLRTGEIICENGKNTTTEYIKILDSLCNIFAENDKPFEHKILYEMFHILTRFKNSLLSIENSEPTSDEYMQFSSMYCVQKKHLKLLQDLAEQFGMEAVDAFQFMQAPQAIYHSNIRAMILEKINTNDLPTVLGKFGNAENNPPIIAG